MRDDSVRIRVTEQPTKDPETGPIEIVLYHQPITGGKGRRGDKCYRPLPSTLYNSLIVL